MKNEYEIMCCDSFPELVLIDFACVYCLYTQYTLHTLQPYAKANFYYDLFKTFFGGPGGFLPGELILGGGGG